MAFVHRVRDASSGKLVALKRLRPLADEKKARFARSLFEREYHTLSQLAHPRVVEVYDYGVDDQGPFYTMELLDGGDLQQLVPIDWRRACTVVQDVCSVLALLHSRRMVHRDIGPRNVRLTADGAAKLFDLGAMAPMGPARDVVGTPAICAPEVVNMESIDARADLFSLGCTLYYALVGKHAYPASTFQQLPLMWNSTPTRPARLVDDLPAELDSLIMSMIHPEREARPSSAAEVMDRLSAIAGLPVNEELPVSHAYLVSPSLVGREGLLSRLRKDLARARSRKGRSVVILGPPGLGRSRLLDAVLLEAKLGGALVVRADGVDAQAGEEAVVMALGRRLLDQQPELARRTAGPHTQVLAHLFPELLPEGAEPAAFTAPLQRRPLLQQALRGWFEATSAELPLVVGIDDFDALDEFSAAFVALLAHGAADHKLAVVATADSAASRPPAGAMKLLVESSRCLELKCLRSRETEALLRSVFGDIPNIQRLAFRIHALSEGNPRDVMDLSHHFVERGVIRYASGAWIVPSELNESDLPRSMADAMASKVAALDEDALDLARAVATVHLPLDLAELRAVTDHGSTERLMRSLDSLLVAGILQSRAERFQLSQRAWVTPLLAGMDEATRGQIHRRLVGLFQKRGDAFRAAQNLFRAGDHPRGLELLVRNAVSEAELTDRDPEAYSKVMRQLPPDWRETYELGIERCRREGRTRDTYALARRMLGLAADGTGDPKSAAALLALLTTASGLDLWPQLHAVPDPAERVRKMFELATKRFHEMDEQDRLFLPVEALKPLAQVTVLALGAIASRLDLSLLESLPSLSPFTGLSPAMGAIMALAEGLRARLTGRTADAVAVYEKLLAGLNDDWKGDATHRYFVAMGVMSGLGYLEAPMGRPRALEWADKIEPEPVYQLNALRIRMVYYLWQGDAARAEEYRQQVEVLRVQNNPRVFQEGLHLMGEALAHAFSDDLVRVKQLMPELARRGEELPAWRPIAHFLRGEYQRIRGASADALDAHQLAASLVEVGRHQLFGEITGAYLAALHGVGRSEEARDRGTEALKAAVAEGLGYTTHFLRMPLAIAHARLGEHAEATELAQHVLRELDRPEVGNLLRGLAHEASARVAIEMGDKEVFEKHAQACAGLYREHGNRALVTKHMHLLHDARRAGLLARRDSEPADCAPGTLTLASVFSDCEIPEARAERALKLMLESSRASAGALFAVDHHAPTLAARQGDLPETALLVPLVRETLIAEVDDDVDITATDSDSGGASTTTVEKWLGARLGATSRIHTLLVAHNEGADFVVTGLAVFVVPHGQPFVPPVELATQLSRYWHAVGDASALGTQAQWSRTRDT